LRVIGAALPGAAVVDGALEEKCAIRIMTGAPVPAGVDAIVMREMTDEREVGDGFISVLEAAPKGQHIRKRGEDVADNDVVARVGDMITPARMNLLLSAGHVTARVRRRPVVGVLASGDELREVGLNLGARDVVNSNAHAIASAARALGCDVHLLGIARDSLEDHVRRIESGAFCDALITIGGVSMGTHDFTRPALEKIGATIDVWRVAMKPGKPIAFARKGALRVFGLPGNPVSALVSFELFVRPALLKMSGLVAKTRAFWPAKLDADFAKKPGLEVYARGQARLEDGALVVALLEGQGSHHVSVLARSNALVRFGRDVERAQAGATVDAMLLADPLTREDAM
jgi:molybdopterin molybdotransferase